MFATRMKSGGTRAKHTAVTAEASSTTKEAAELNGTDTADITDTTTAGTVRIGGAVAAKRKQDTIAQARTKEMRKMRQVKAIGGKMRRRSLMR